MQKLTTCKALTETKAFRKQNSLPNLMSRHTKKKRVNESRIGLSPETNDPRNIEDNLHNCLVPKFQ